MQTDCPPTFLDGRHHCRCLNSPTAAFTCYTKHTHCNHHWLHSTLPTALPRNNQHCVTQPACTTLSSGSRSSITTSEPYSVSPSLCLSFNSSLLLSASLRPAMDTLPARSRMSITKQDLWHQHHVFASPSPDIQHSYATRYSTTHNQKPPMTDASSSSTLPLIGTSTFHTDQPSGATRNHAYTHSRALPPTETTYVEHYPRSTGTSSSTLPAQYERHDYLPAITFPSPIATGNAYCHDDVKHRASAYVVSNRFAYNPQPAGITHSSTSHSTYIDTRPSSAPSPYHQAPATTGLNGYTRNNAYTYVDELLHDNAKPRCRGGRFESEYDSRINHSSHLAETERLKRAEGAVTVGKRAVDEHSGFTRRVSAPPCEGVGTEHAGLRVFAGLVGKEAGRDSGWEEKQQLEVRGPAFDSSVPCVANGGLSNFYSTTAQRHYRAASPPSSSESAIQSAIQSAIDSGYTHNSHLIPATAKLNGKPHIPSAPHGRAISAATPNTLTTDGRPSHFDYSAPDSKRVELVGPVTRRYIASAYSRESATHVLSADRQERRWERRVDGKFVQQPEAVQRLDMDILHPTVRAMMEVQEAEKRGNIKNYGADLDLFDHDWVPDVVEEEQSS